MFGENATDRGVIRGALDESGVGNVLFTGSAALWPRARASHGGWGVQWQ